MLFLIVKSLHIISIMAWMAGLMLYPRYKIHQLGDEPNGILFERMKDASGKLKKIILTPSMFASWLFGFGLVAINPGIISAGGPFWFPIKLALVLLITGFHGWFTVQGKKIDAGVAAADARKLRMLNEVPFLALIGIVFLVILKPF
ncbi:MAG: CopD family protein [Hyphomonadaceae bacterium]